MLVLALNPGSTSTKVGLFEDDRVLFLETVNHNHDEVQKFGSIGAQKEFRLGVIREKLKDVDVGKIDGVVAIGGLLPPVQAGGYKVNEKMVRMLTEETDGVSPHASNLGAILADILAKEAGCEAFIYDAVSAGILPEVARITGFPEIVRRSLSHVLNSRAQAIEYAKKIGKKFEELNVIIAHLGGGVSLSVYKKGVLMDSVGDDLGPFSSERSGVVPLFDFLDFAFADEKRGKKELQRRIRGGGGLKAHLGSADLREIEANIETGDTKAELIVDAMCYNVAKAIASLAVAVHGNCNVIILTGGMMNSKRVASGVRERVEFIAPVEVMAGEYELEALVGGCVRILNGEERALEF
ncbi:MAG: butyrate kinase [Turicibacter sp.]|nr:butyrate kinase [Turicibacter sp.]